MDLMELMFKWVIVPVTIIKFIIQPKVLFPLGIIAGAVVTYLAFVK
jgi:hypothetical protein